MSRAGLGIGRKHAEETLYGASVSVCVYRGCAIPVAWKIVGAEEKGRWQPHWITLLSHLSESVPDELDGSGAQRSGLVRALAFEHIVGCGWHPFMRINKQGNVRPLGEAELSWSGIDRFGTKEQLVWQGRVF